MSLKAYIYCGGLMIIYSAIFLYGWNFHYPTRTEQTLWRLSSCITLAYIFPSCVWLCHLECKYFDDWRKRRNGGQWVFKCHLLVCRILGLASSATQEVYPENRRKPWKRALPTASLVILIAMCVIYAGARVYVLVEDIAGLRRLPESAFETKEWTQYLPQI